MRFPVLLPLAVPSPEQAWRLVGTLYAQPRSLVEGSLALLAVHVVCFARTGSPIFAALAAACLLVTAARLAQRTRYSGVLTTCDGEDDSGPSRWAGYFAAGACASAALWGVTDLATLLLFRDPGLQLFVMMVQAGWLGGAGVRNAASPASVAGQAFLTLLPSLLGVALAQDRFIYVAAPFLLVHLGATLGIARFQGTQIATLMESERKLADANMRLTLLSATDGLTGIGNRRAFDNVLPVEWARAAREATDLALLMIDIDYFKLFNDRHGHLRGDDCLRAVAGLVQGSLRRPPDFAARYGGEEFAVLLPATSEAGAREVAERLRHALELAALPHAASPFGRITVSIGVASMAPTPGEEPHGLIALADRALYDAKQSGRDCVCAASDGLRLDAWHEDAPPHIPPGLPVLVLENDAAVAGLLQDMLGELGCVVSGPCGSAADALAVINAGAPRVALLATGRAVETYRVADALAARGVPFAFVTGDANAPLRPDLAGRPVLEKPFRFAMLGRLVSDLARCAA